MRRTNLRIVNQGLLLIRDDAGKNSFVHPTLQATLLYWRVIISDTALFKSEQVQPVCTCTRRTSAIPAASITGRPRCAG